MAKYTIGPKLPDTRRNTALAGQTVSSGNYNITYDENGMAQRAQNYTTDHNRRSGVTAAPSTDSVDSGGVDRSSYGGSGYDQRYFSNDELARAADAVAKAQAGEISWGYAHDYVENIRKKYGYSGGEDGHGYVSLSGEGQGGSGSGNGGFSYENMGGYTGRYQDQIDQLVGEILGREDFSYDAQQDPLYRMYEESYTRNGQRAMEDTLGQVSARTGGLASSYAAGASQDAYDRYMEELSGKIPELYQLAYSMYQDEGDRMRSDLSMLQGLDDTDYSRYLADRDYSYQLSRDQVEDSRYNQQWDYQLGRDQVEDERYRDETDWERSQYTSQTEYNQALAKAETLAAAGDFSGYKALGYTDGEIANLQAAYQLARSATGGAGSGGRTGGGDQEGVERNSLASDALEWAKRTGGDAADFIKAYYKDYGYSSQSAALSALNVYQAENQDLGDLDVRNGMYDRLGDSAKQVLSSIQRSAYRNGNTGLTDGQKEKLEQYVTQGKIEDWELGVILDLLGY